MLRGWAQHACLLTSSPLLCGIQNMARDNYGDWTSTLLVSTYHRRREREIAMRKRGIYIEDTMKLAQMLSTPVGLMPGTLQSACMLEEKVQRAGEDTP